MKKDSIFINFLIILIALVFIYPLVWMFVSSFKFNNEIISSISLLPRKIDFESYLRAWNRGQYTYGYFVLNSIRLVVPVVFFTVVSSIFVGYGFGRFNFPFKNILFTIMLATLMLPNAVVIIPRYILFSKLGWVNSYLPFIIPAAFGLPFFIYMMVQFIRGLPRELDESAYMDGCGSLSILIRIIFPLLKPAVISVIIFQFIWTWNNFFDSLIFINSLSKYTVQLALRMSIDVSGDTDWAAILGQSCIALIPCLIVFFSAQKYFVEGVATSGMKN